MKKTFIIALLLSIIGCKQSKQQKAERVVENYIHIFNNREAIKKTKFTELTTYGTSDKYEIGIIKNKYDAANHVYWRTIWYVLDHNLTRVEWVETL